MDRICRALITRRFNFVFSLEMATYKMRLSVNKMMIELLDGRVNVDPECEEDYHPLLFKLQELGFHQKDLVRTQGEVELEHVLPELERLRLALESKAGKSFLNLISLCVCVCVRFQC